MKLSTTRRIKALEAATIGPGHNMPQSPQIARIVELLTSQMSTAAAVRCVKAARLAGKDEATLDKVIENLQIAAAVKIVNIE